jgi:hypothetical protein
MNFSSGIIKKYGLDVAIIGGGSGGDSVRAVGNSSKPLGPPSEKMRLDVNAPQSFT